MRVKVNIQKVIESIEHRKKVYTEAIQDIMLKENIPYHQAKFMLNVKMSKHELR